MRKKYSFGKQLTIQVQPKTSLVCVASEPQLKKKKPTTTNPDHKPARVAILIVGMVA